METVASRNDGGALLDLAAAFDSCARTQRSSAANLDPVSWWCHRAIARAEVWEQAAALCRAAARRETWAAPDA